jgi:hypothetical protein
MWAEYWFRARASRTILPIALAAATPIAAVPLASPPSPPKPLTAYDAERKLRLIDLALDILQKDMEPIVHDRHNIADGWIYAYTIPHKAAVEYNDATIAYFGTITTTLEMLEQFKAKHPHEQDIIRVTLPTYRESLIKAAGNLNKAFTRTFVLGQAIPLETEQFLMEPFVTEFKRATEDFVNWRAAAIAELMTMRKAISPL